MPPLKANKISAIFRSQIFDLAMFVLLVAVLVYLAVKSAGNIGYYWQWYQVPPLICSFGENGFQAGPLLDGLLVTLKISAISLFFSSLIGIIAALMRLSQSAVACLLSRLYLELIRNTPLLIQIFFIYFVLGPVIGLGRFASAVLALSLFEGAYTSEILRSGILAIPKGQYEAADSLGLGKLSTYRYIILPQAIRKTLPPLISQAVSLVKDSALVSTIAIYDLTMQAQALTIETFLTFEIWFTVALIYLFITVLLSMTISLVERWLG
ncbi:MAG: polar amino acid ABC transporter permease [Deltaproteobacteria bacterium]|nr:MAG: polar amino acid ABC transporter permease [Deltaproteobacteria bacterium]